MPVQPRDALRHGRRSDRQRHPRQGPPRRRLVREPRDRDGDAARRRSSTRPITPASDPDLWWATIGGMGLTGIILRATFGLIPIETQHMPRRHRAGAEPRLAARADGVGRPPVPLLGGLDRPGRHGRAPRPIGAVDAATMRRSTTCATFQPRAAANAARVRPAVDPRRAARRAEHGRSHSPCDRSTRCGTARRRSMHHGIETLTAFFHPLDMVGKWNRLYGRHGFLQYQFVVPFEAVDTLRTIVTKISDEGDASSAHRAQADGRRERRPAQLPHSRAGRSRSTSPAGDSGLAELVARPRRARPRRRRAALSRQGLPRHPRGHPRRLSPPRRMEGDPLAGSIPTAVWASDQARRLDLL